MILELTTNEASLAILAIGQGMSTGRFTDEERSVLRALLQRIGEGTKRDGNNGSSDTRESDPSGRDVGQ